MSNSIYFSKSEKPSGEELRMQNAQTDIFLNVLALSGSELAETEDEKRLIVWLLEKDQTIGRGTVGFCICDMPWNKVTFPENKAFMLKVIQAAENKTGWERLDYTPNEEWLIPSLKQFAALISGMQAKYIQENRLRDWLADADEDDPIRCHFPRCQKHDTLLTFLGCQICNS